MVEPTLLTERQHEPPRYGDRQACSASRYPVGRPIPHRPDERMSERPGNTSAVDWNKGVVRN
jgi:hypothetical protein